MECGHWFIERTFSFLTYFAGKLWHQDARRWFLYWDNLWMRIKEDFRRELLKIAVPFPSTFCPCYLVLMLQGDKWTSVALKSGNELSGTPQPVLPALSWHSSSCFLSLRCMSSSTDLGRVQHSSRSRTQWAGLYRRTNFHRTSSHTRIPGFPSFLLVWSLLFVYVRSFKQQSDVLHPDVELKPQPLNGQTCTVVSTFH